jgi:hypothetical protein
VQPAAGWHACKGALITSNILPHIQAAPCTACSLQKATNNFTTSKFTTSGGGQEGWDLPGLALSGIQTWLKLRTRYQARAEQHDIDDAAPPLVFATQQPASAACRHRPGLLCWRVS